MFNQIESSMQVDKLVFLKLWYCKNLKNKFRTQSNNFDKFIFIQTKNYIMHKSISSFRKFVIFYILVIFQTKLNIATRN